MNPTKLATLALFFAMMFGVWFGIHRYIDAFGHPGIYAAMAVGVPLILFGLWWEYRATKAVPWIPLSWLTFAFAGITWWAVS